MLKKLKLLKINSKGFTIIELIVVIAIIGVLATIIISNISGYTAKARDSKRKSDVEVIAKALNLFYADSGTYKTIAGVDGYGSGWLNAPYGGSIIANALITNKYLGSDPVDPKPATGMQDYLLCVGSDGQHFTVFTRLEGAATNTCVIVSGNNCNLTNPPYLWNYCISQ